MEKQKFLRMGELPILGKSFNYFHPKSQDVENFLRAGLDLDEVLLFCRLKSIDDVLEKGVSCFYLEEGKPLLKNLQQVQSLWLRRDYPAFIMEAEEVGRGSDNEPLVTNIANIEAVSFSVEEVIEKTLRRNYEEVTPDTEGFKGLFVSDSRFDEKARTFIEVHEVHFNGFVYRKPREGWSTTLGWKLMLP